MRYIGIDPSTKTGFVVLDESGAVLVQKEITGVGTVDPKRMATLVQDLVSHLQAGDFIAIEGFSYGSKGKGLSVQYGLGACIRVALWSRKYQFIEVSPGGLKKFATGKGNTPKDKMPEPIEQRWGWSHRSDNVTDAFVLAQIAYSSRNTNELKLTSYQVDVIQAITKTKVG